MREREREGEGPFSANVKTNATPPTCSCVVGERSLLSSSAATCCASEHVSNSIGIDELVTLISFPYIVGLSVPAVNSRRALFMRSSDGVERRRLSKRPLRPGPSLKRCHLSTARGIVSLSPPFNCIRS